MIKKYIPHRKLELDWFKKDKALVWDINTGKYEWVENNEVRVSEPRVLKLKERTGEVNSRYNKENKKWVKSDDEVEPNMLIKGDNLLALKSLEDNFIGRIKLIYIDPPFNTGNAFKYYEDGLEHSIWLGMMKNRLKILHNLLKEDGVIFAHIDDKEGHYLKLLMDEEFGRKNFVASIALLSSTPSGVKTAHRNKTIVKTKDFILVYKNKVSSSPFKPMYKKRKKWDTHFNYFLDKESLHLYPLKEILHKGKIYDKKTSAKDYDINFLKFKEFYIKNKENIMQTGKTMPLEARKKSLKFKDKVIGYTDNNGNKQFAYNGRRLSPLSKSFHEYYLYSPSEGGWIKKQDLAILLCDFWEDIDYNNTQNEGDVSFPASKKPEELLFRIIELTTEEGEYVLDSFAGSGTTGVVAHKMGRKWIMVEIGEHAETHCKKRLKNVINGKDQDKHVYGGGFNYYELAPSLFKKDKQGIVQLAFSSADLVEAICKIEGFKFVGRDFLNKTRLHGSVNGDRFCHITEEMVTQDLIEELAEEISDKESLIIYCTKLVSNLDLPENIQVKKIPRDLMGRFKI